MKATEPSLVWGITAGQFAEMRQEIMDWNVERFEKRQQFIHSIPLFQKLEQHELLNMTHACHAEIYDINDYIIKPGVAAKNNTNVYIIMEGTVVVSYTANEENKYIDVETIDGDMSSPIQRLMTDDIEVGGMKLGINLNSDMDLNSDADDEMNINFGKKDSLGINKHAPLTLELNLNSLTSQRSDPKWILMNNGSCKASPKSQNGNGNGNGNGKMFGHHINVSDPPLIITDPPILEDIDSNPTL